MYQYTQAIGQEPEPNGPPLVTDPVACAQAGGSWDHMTNECILPSAPEPPTIPLLPEDPIYQDILLWRRRAYYVIRPAATINGLYHGYKRNESIGWALAWGLFGACFPVTSLIFSSVMKPGWSKRKIGR